MDRRVASEMVGTVRMRARRVAMRVVLLVGIAVAAVGPGWRQTDHALAQEVGTTRGAPVPVGTEVVSGDLGIAVAEVLRGEDAFERLKEANPFNAERPDGEEYVLVRLRVRHVGDEDELKVDATDIGLTASGNVLYPAVAAVAPEPALDATLFPGDQTQGWVPLRVGQEETHRQVVYAPDFQDEYDRWRFLALDDEGALPLPGEPTVPAPNDVGADEERPAAPGEAVVTDYFAVQVVESVRGEEATARLAEIDTLGTAPAAGFHDLLVKVRMTSRIAEDFPILVSGLDFSVVSGGDVPFLPTYSMVPQPDLFALLYPAGTVDGWIAFEIEAEVGAPILAYLWQLEPDPKPRFLAVG